MGVAGSPGCEEKMPTRIQSLWLLASLKEGGVVSLPGYASKAFYPWSGQLALPLTALLPFVFIA